MRRPLSLRWRRARPGLVQDTRSATMMEFAIVGPIFLTFLFFIFEVAYDEYLQEVLETTLNQTAHQMQVDYESGTSYIDTAGNGSTFVSSFFCPNDLGLLNCNNVFVRIERYESSTSCTDFYGAVTGELPAAFSGNAWALGLGLFNSGAGAGTGGSDGPSTTCISATSAAGFCDVGPKETIIMSAVYIAPSFLTALLPRQYTYSYNGSIVRAPFATDEFESEDFPPQPTNANQC